MPEKWGVAKRFFRRSTVAWAARYVKHATISPSPSQTSVPRRMSQRYWHRGGGRRA